MTDILIGTFLLIAVLLLDLVLAIARSAFIYCHPAMLKRLQEQGIARAGLTIRVASNARRLILSLRTAQSMSRLIVIGFALAVYGAPFITTDGPTGIVLSGVFLSAGLLIAPILHHNRSLRQLTNGF